MSRCVLKMFVIKPKKLSTIIFMYLFLMEERDYEDNNAQAHESQEAALC